ncbi:MAG: histidinol-phosphate transaminase [Kiritimatiellaeota bacterium]|nr:histidinol-phosphate transaminase [Kiritimatiellota bacterium]
MIAKHIQALHAYTPGEQPQIPGLIKLNTNENPYPPSPAVFEALRAFDATRLRLYPDPVCKALRGHIAEMHGCAIENVFAGNGSDEILALASRAFVEPHETIGFLDPSYSLYPVLAAIQNVRTRVVKLEDDFSWQVPATCHDAFFYLTNPNAPTSLRASREHVAAFCEKSTGIVLIDEAYADFADDHCMPLATAPENKNTIVMRTLSKSFSLAGLRFGYCVGPEPLIHALYKIKDSYNVDMLTATLALAALQDLPHMRANVAKIKATRGRLAATLRGRGFTLPDSQTNFLFARPPGGDAKKLLQHLRDKKILVRHFDLPATREHIRITIGTDAEADALLAALD